MKYLVVVEKGENGFGTYVPDLPGCVAAAESIESQNLLQRRITIRLDGDVVQWFKSEIHAAGGGNYQTLMNHALREYMVNSQEPLEEVLRRVLREELKNVG